MIDLDHNATTRPSDAVVDAMSRVMREAWHNPSSVHRAGQEARHAVELARASIARLIHARPREIVVTGSGTEAIDLAIRGALASVRRAAPAETTLVTTRVEHAAGRDLAEHLGQAGDVELRWAPVDAAGRADTEALAGLIDETTALVSVQWANNETGAIQPIERIGELCRARGVLFHCDATQWVGKMPTDVSAAPIDLLTCAPHKFNGPKGVGLLWARRGVRVVPTLHGIQELGRRGGTENVPGIVGAGVAAEEAIEWLARPELRDAQEGLRDGLERRVLERCPGAVVHAAGTPRLWNTSNIAFPRLGAEALLLAMSEMGLCASAGAACASGSLEPSPVIRAMGVPEHLAVGSVRFSIGRHTTPDEVGRAVEIIAEAVSRVGGSSAALRPAD